MTRTDTTEIVVFTNPDFAPSQRMVATVEDLIDEQPDLRVARVDALADPGKVIHHEVLTVPTTIVFVGGREVARLTGLRSRRALRRAIDKARASQQPARAPSAVSQTELFGSRL